MGDANFGSQDKRNVSGSISRLVDDLLISGCGEFIGYVTQQMQRKLRGGAFEEMEQFIYVSELVKPNIRMGVTDRKPPPPKKFGWSAGNTPGDNAFPGE